MKNKFWLILFALILPLMCFAEETIYEYSVHYAGLPVALVKITLNSTDSLQTITLESTSKGLVSALFPIENTYVSSCNTAFLPYYFWKTIYQQNVKEKKIILFNQKEGSIIIRNVLNNRADTLQCSDPIHDIVSVSFSLLSDVPEQKCYACYGNYRIWQLNAEKSKTVTLSFQKKKYECFEYKIKSEIQYDSKIDSKTDILTNNIFKNNGTTYYWISKEAPHLLLKAKYNRFPFSIYLYLNNIHTQ
ncbi:MAG: DUF3108 domain-containing protein [Candidatus Cloacimonetes bacterium]|nr:DUF3108 domain-containing protein [Candidatus Cloacimonadota bacterium]